MKIRRLFSLAQLAAIIYFAVPANAQIPAVSLIPEPKSMKVSTERFLLSSATSIVYQGQSARIAGDLLNEFIFDKYGYKLNMRASRSGAEKSGIVILLDKLAAPEAYDLTVQASVIKLSGSITGLFYGIQTLQQLAPLNKSDAFFNGVSIKDEPRFGYRGLMLDVSRHFYSVGYLKKFLDVMSHFKLNRFHWHLTDDQGWRIEIKKYPRLQSVAAWREPLENLRNSEFIKDGKYGGFYTQKEIKEVVDYAAGRHITIIPEIEMPGHSLAALSAYPELGCTEGPYKPMQYGGISRDVYCAGKEQTFSFLQDVLEEVIPLFPGSYVHIGGDESPKDRWKACAHCQKRIKEEGLKDEHELQSYFVLRIEKFVNSHGRKIIGWDEILEGGLAPNATVMSWRGENGGIAAAKQHHDVIMSPYTYLYLDYYQGDSRREPPAFPAYLPLEKVYSYEPLSPLLTAAQHSYIKGVQGNLWSENIRNGKHADYMLFPRALALSEIGWSPASAKKYSFFLKKLELRLASLEQDYKVNFRIPEPLNLKDELTTRDSITINPAPPIEGSVVYFTIDGSEPSINAKKYTLPLSVPLTENVPMVVKAIVVLNTGRQSAVYSARYEKKSFKKSLPLNPTKSGVRYKMTAEKITSAKNMQVRDAKAAGSVSGFDLSPFAPVPGLGVIYEGFMLADTDAMYTFKLNSDDGAVLFIDDEIVVDNDGAHAALEINGSIPLRKGFHKIRLHYFDAGGGRVLELKALKDSREYELKNKIFIQN